jgi:hypothetical protein
MSSFQTFVVYVWKQSGHENTWIKDQRGMSLEQWIGDLNNIPKKTGEIFLLLSN